MSRISASLAQLALNQKSSKGVSLYSRFVNRPAGRFFAAVGHLIGMTPNQMTLVAIAFGLAAIGVVWYCGAAGLIAGAVLLQIQSILDGCDGEISRLKYLRSRLGEWLDQVFDDVVNLGYFAVVGYTLYAAGSSIAGWLTVLGAGAHLVYQAALYTALLTRGGGSGSVTSIRWWGQKPAVRSQPRNL